MQIGDTPIFLWEVVVTTLEIFLRFSLKMQQILRQVDVAPWSCNTACDDLTWQKRTDSGVFAPRNCEWMGYPLSATKKKITKDRYINVKYISKMILIKDLDVLLCVTRDLMRTLQSNPRDWIFFEICRWHGRSGNVVSLQREITPNNYQPGAVTTARNWYKQKKSNRCSADCATSSQALRVSNQKSEPPVVAVAIFQGIGHWPLKKIKKYAAATAFRGTCKGCFWKCAEIESQKILLRIPHHFQDILSIYIYVFIIYIYILYFTQYIYI